MKANRLFWLGRYAERVYMTLHLLRKCYDKMIDGEPSDYEDFWKKLDAQEIYKEPEEFTFGMMYDENNVNSILSSLIHALDNAILLREDLTSETLSFIEMSISYIKNCKMKGVTNITELQPVTDWMLAFWGSCEERVVNSNEMNMMLVGKYIEKMDLCLRFSYPFKSIDLLYTKLIASGNPVKDLLFDPVAEKDLEHSILMYKNTASDDILDYNVGILYELNQLVKV